MLSDKDAFIWTKETSMQLIDLYHKNNILWDPKHNNYKNRMKKDEMWREIGMILNAHTHEVQRKMKNILTQYCRERQKYKKLRKEGRAETFHTNWFAYKSLQFLSFKNRDRRIRHAYKNVRNSKTAGSKCNSSNVDKNNFNVPHIVEMSPHRPEIQQPNQKTKLRSSPALQNNSLNIVNEPIKKDETPVLTNFQISETTTTPQVNNQISDNQQTGRPNTPSQEYETIHKENVCQRKEEDEFDVFARGVAIQMRKLHPLVAYDIELQITTLLTTAKRDQYLKNMQQNAHPSALTPTHKVERNWTQQENTSQSSTEIEPEREQPYMITFSPKIEPNENDEYII